MKRAIIMFGIFWSVLSSVAMAQPSLYTEGKEYLRGPKEILDNPTVQDFRKETNKKIQVLEFFSYGCSWCFKLDPYVDTWEKKLPADVSFQRVPVEFHSSWQTLAKAYYTAMELHQFEKMHPAIFAAIHNNQLTDSSEDVLRQFFAQHGITAEDFNKAYASFDVNRRQKWANAISQAYRITAIPAIVVQGPNGSYLTTLRMAGSEENLLKVVDFLIQQENLPVTPSVQSKQ